MPTRAKAAGDEEFMLGLSGKLVISYSGTGKITLRWGDSARDGRSERAKLTADALAEQLGPLGLVTAENVEDLAAVFGCSGRTVYRAYEKLKRARKSATAAARCGKGANHAD